METKTYQLQEQSLQGRLECSVRSQPIPDRILYSAIPWVGRIAYEIMYPIRFFIVCDHSLVHVLHHLVPQCACLIKESLCATRSMNMWGNPVNGARAARCNDAGEIYRLRSAIQVKTDQHRPTHCMEDTPYPQGVRQEGPYRLREHSLPDCRSC